MFIRINPYLCHLLTRYQSTIFPNHKSCVRKKGVPKRFFPFCFVCRCMRDSAPATSKRPFQGLGVSAKVRGTARAQRECESRFPLQNRREESKRFFPLLHIGTEKPISTTSECTFREEIWPTQRAIAEPTRNTGLPFHSKGPKQSNPKVFF